MIWYENWGTKQLMSNLKGECKIKYGENGGNRKCAKGKTETEARIERKPSGEKVNGAQTTRVKYNTHRWGNRNAVSKHKWGRGGNGREESTHSPTTTDVSVLRDSERESQARGQDLTPPSRCHPLPCLFSPKIHTSQGSHRLPYTHSDTYSTYKHSCLVFILGWIYF